MDKYTERPDYFPEQLVDNWSSFSRLGLYYCYKISLEGCSETSIPAEIVLAVKCDMGSDFISNSFKLFGVKAYINVTIRYDGINHLNQEQVNFDLHIIFFCNYHTILSLSLPSMQVFLALHDEHTAVCSGNCS